MNIERSQSFIKQTETTISPQEQQSQIQTISTIFSGLQDLGKSLISRKHKEEILHQRGTLYLPNLKGLVLPTRLQIEKGGVLKPKSRKDLVLAVSYGYPESSNSPLLIGGAHHRLSLENQGIDPESAITFTALLGDFPGQFFNYADYFAFWLRVNPDNEGVEIVLGDQTPGIYQVERTYSPETAVKIIEKAIESI